MDSNDRASGSRTRLKIFANFMSVAVFILVIFMTSILVNLQKDVNHLRDDLATKEDLTNLAVNLGPSDPAMAALEGTCTDCHTKETFAAAHNMTEDVHDLVGRMAQLSGAHFGTEEIPRAEAALTFMKCSHCHSQDRLKELAILSPAERWEVITGMMKKEGSTITQEDARRIRDFYGDFWGWHTP